MLVNTMRKTVFNVYKLPDTKNPFATVTFRDNVTRSEREIHDLRSQIGLIYGVSQFAVALIEKEEIDD